MTFLLSTKTPTIDVVDNRGLNIRTFEYHRHPNALNMTDERISYQQFNIKGHLYKSTDPRLHIHVQANFCYHYDLLGTLLYSNGVDNGEVRRLNDIEGRLLVSIDANNIWRTCDYEGKNTLGRLIRCLERDAVTIVSDYFVYAGNSPVEQANNLAGHCISHYDPAGLLQLNQISLTGSPLSTARCFIQDAENAEVIANWRQGEMDNTLSQEIFVNQKAYDATGSILLTQDAKGHQQRLFYDIAGQCIGHWLTISSEPERVLVQSITYTANGNIVREEWGNGVVSWNDYEPQTQRLIRSRTERPVAHPLGFKRLQDLRYQYDPVGNIVCIYNNAEPVRFWRNQKIEPKQSFVYDSLYQLVSASGREMASNITEKTKLPRYCSFDSMTITQYFRTYQYDRSGNLIQIHHRAPATNQCYTQSMTTSTHSNRAVLDSLTAHSDEVDHFFTPSGQQTQLFQGQCLDWTVRQELRQVYQGEVNEHYRYDSNSQRVLKVSQQKSNSYQTYYLDDLELRYKQIHGKEAEQLQLIVVGNAGIASIRALHWTNRRADIIKNNVIRYSINALAGSGDLELDQSGQLMSYEEYYPYGGTAIWAARSALEGEDKTHRYSGKERDATGLYYYGYRYYQPWCGRWLSADPGGTVDGLNLFRMARNNPLKYKDNNGLNPFNQIVEYYHRRIDEKAKIRANESYKIMSTGTDWVSRDDDSIPFMDLDSFNAMTQDNMQNLRLAVGEIRGDSLEFVNNFNELKFDLIHFTDKRFLERGSHAVFRSRDSLLDKMLIRSDHTNTTDFDFVGLKTKDFVFFSLGVEGVTGKMGSRFGDLKYVTPLNSVRDYKYLKYGHMAINDTMLFDKRMTSQGRLVDKFRGDLCAAATLTHEKIATKPSDTLYPYSDFKEALALRIVKSTRLLNKHSQQIVFSTTSDAEFDNLISLFYRPQILVPKKLHSKNTRIVQGQRMNIH
ncbi:MULTISPECIES: RHS repeat-associated core domain-containing protein [Providencia]|uniref:RHS repeat-associated core domain-containing protein n=1 Tax=Providencia TaxID=586 RepID=UPI00197FB462|nr:MULTISPECIES: RHS repeat-associated core domain-containing protein [Providencia]MBN4866757.1 RHS repeat protein [Providencia stuartii]MBN4875971.1 RHS repeat protein [Providencia stuartii]MBN4880771.1 RHS repeat protein [Providencia stuartii]MBN4885171.1 RHS repeat protein [Providencia stuartii]